MFRSRASGSFSFCTRMYRLAPRSIIWGFALNSGPATPNPKPYLENLFLQVSGCRDQCHLTRLEITCYSEVFMRPELLCGISWTPESIFGGSLVSPSERVHSHFPKTHPTQQIGIGWPGVSFSVDFN